MAIRVAAVLFTAALMMPAQQAEPAAENNAQQAKQFSVEPGTKIPLNLINSVSTKNAAEGDRVYLETAFPVVVDGKIVIPPGSYVAGTITQVKRPGRVKGKGELFLRFDSLTLPNGVTRDFRARISGLDGRTSEALDRDEGKVVSEGNKSGDARTVGETAATGTWIGTVAGASSGRVGMGAGVGAAAGATAGLLGVLLSRGPDAMLAKGSTIEMVLDRQLRFAENELDFSHAMQRMTPDSGGAFQPNKKASGPPGIGRRFPLN
jgi:type IV secretion system protein VirB10